jgi:hypothetical protein
LLAQFRGPQTLAGGISIADGPSAMLREQQELLALPGLWWHRLLACGRAAVGSAAGRAVARGTGGFVFEFLEFLEDWAEQVHPRRLAEGADILHV